MSTGKSFTKNPTSHCVINIVPEREIWEQVQPPRTKLCSELRCGPHITLVDPFVMEHFYEPAAELLQKELLSVEPITVDLSEFNYFEHEKSFTLYVEPKPVPADALVNLEKKIRGVFPQCNDQVKKSKEGTYTPHMSIGRFRSKKDLNVELTKLKKTWKPLKFVVKEIYLLSRAGVAPFEVKHVIHLGKKVNHKPSHFGPGMSLNPTSALARSVVLLGFPKTLTDDSQLVELAAAAGFKPTKAEITVNPDLKSRGFGVIEFATLEEAQKCYKEWNHQPYGTESNVKLAVKLLSHMVYPSVVGGCTSIKAVGK